MSFSPILLFHICSGTVGVLSGFAAVSFRKGSRRHRVAGNVFVVSMLGLGASGAYMGFMKHQTLNGLMGILTLYLVTTAWWTARRRDKEVSIFDWAALLVSLAIVTTFVTFGLAAANQQTGSKGGDPVAAFFIFGSVALLAAVGDVRMLMRRGIAGTQRLVRHLWRMCFTFFIGSASIFLARPHLFPALLSKTYVLFSPGYPAADIDDFLAMPSSLHQCIQEKAGAARSRGLLARDLAFHSQTALLAILVCEAFSPPPFRHLSLYNICGRRSSTRMDV